MMLLSERALAGRAQAELEELAKAFGQPAFRGRQMAAWIYDKAAQEIEAMRDLPAPFRARLIEEGWRLHPIEEMRRMSSSDGVDKLLVHGGDQQGYECVLLPYSDRVSCCLSSQVGCPMGCRFCATGLGGFQRNLSVGEIVGQYLMLQGLTERRISHVVFMGMGEPLLNLDNLLKAIGLLHDQVGLSHRRITVSTVGIVPQMRRLAELALPIHLALSLHSPLDEIRSELMPVNQKWPVAEAMDALREWSRATGRKATIEYLLISERNDSAEEAAAHAGLLKGLPHVVNLIPFNWVDTGHGYSRPSRARVQAFRSSLEGRGVNVTERMERGHDIAAACGQLAGAHAGRFAQRRGPSELPVSS